MQQMPRQLGSTFLSFKEMAISIIQGLVITIAILTVYQLTVQNGGSEIETRTMVFTTLVISNVLLSLVNRSFYYSVFTSLKNKNNMMVFVNTITIVMLGMIVYVSPIAAFFEVQPLTFLQITICFISSAIAILWIEIYKWIKRRKATT